MTKKEMFAEIRNVVADNEEMVAFINHEIELLEKKSGSPRKPTKTQVENESFKADIVATLTMADKPMTIKELSGACASIANLTNQRITHMLTDLRKDGLVARTYVKKVAHFAVGCENEGEEE